VFGTRSNTIKVGVFPTRKLLFCLQGAAREDEVKREKEKDIVLVSTEKQEMKMAAILQYSSTLGYKRRWIWALKAQ
jgi:hypothetical protein